MSFSKFPLFTAACKEMKAKSKAKSEDPLMETNLHGGCNIDKSLGLFPAAVSSKFYKYVPSGRDDDKSEDVPIINESNYPRISADIIDKQLTKDWTKHKLYTGLTDRLFKPLKTMVSKIPIEKQMALFEANTSEELVERKNELQNLICKTVSPSGDCESNNHNQERSTPASSNSHVDNKHSREEFNTDHPKSPTNHDFNKPNKPPVDLREQDRPTCSKYVSSESSVDNNHSKEEFNSNHPKSLPRPDLFRENNYIDNWSKRNDKYSELKHPNLSESLIVNDENLKLCCHRKRNVDKDFKNSCDIIKDDRFNVSPTSCNEHIFRRNLYSLVGHVQVQDYDNRTPLHLAASDGQEETVKFLLNKGAFVHLIDSFGLNPLMNAIRFHRANIIPIFDCDAHIGMGSKQLAIELNHVAASNDVATLRMFYLTGVTFNESDGEGRTPLHVAARLGHEDCVRYMLSRGANPQLKNINNENAIKEALIARNFHIAEILSQKEIECSSEE